MLKTAFLTTERKHLVAMVQLLVGAIPQTLLDDPARPLTMSVCGSFASGKKIIPDTALEMLLPDVDESAMEGRQEYDEFWRGTRKDGKPAEVDFLNFAWGRGYSEKTASPLRLQKFLKQRQHGGISFINNDNYCVLRPRHAIEFWIESDNHCRMQSGTSRLQGAKGGLCEAFHRCAAADDNKSTQWLRYVEVKVNHPDLIACAEFRAALQSLSLEPLVEARPLPPAEQVMQIVKAVGQGIRNSIFLPLNSSDPVPVFGQNIPKGPTP